MTCGLDAVVAVGSEEDAHAYAARHSHDVSIEPITGRRSSSHLTTRKRRLRLRRSSKSVGLGKRPNAEVLQALYQRLAQTLELLDEQERPLTQ